MKSAEISIYSLARFLPNIKKNIVILYTGWFASTITEEKNSDGLLEGIITSWPGCG